MEDGTWLKCLYSEGLSHKGTQNILTLRLVLRLLLRNLEPEFLSLMDIKVLDTLFNMSSLKLHLSR